MTRYQSLGDDDKRTQFLDKKSDCQAFFRALFSIVDQIKGNEMLTLYVLATIDGILEDQRTRVKEIIFSQKSQTKKCDTVKILLNFLQG